MITIKDIARSAGVSPATVSRVLTNSRAVNSELRDRVLKVAHECGYSPNTAARSLVKKETNAIGVVVHNLHDPFFHDLILGFESGAMETDLNVVFCSVMGKNDEDKHKYLRYLSNGVVDGIILYGSYHFDEHFIEEVHTSGFPLFLIENRISGVDTHSFLVNNQQGVYDAVEYLYQHGHRRIAYIAGKPNKSVCLERLAGYRRAMQDLSLDLGERYVLSLENGFEDGADLMERFLSYPAEERPTAVLCYDDATAAAAITRAQALGVSVPGDISVMGFDNQTIPPKNYIGPAITSVSQPLYEIGFDSMLLLSRFLRGDRQERISRTYATTIAQKQSVAHCKEWSSK